MDGSHLEAGDGLGNGDKLARVVGEHLSDLEGSDENLPDTSSFRTLREVESLIPGRAETGTSQPSSPWRP